MHAVRTAVVVLLSLALATPLAAKESGSFIVQLGRDTTSVERYVATPTRVEVDQVGRAPRVLQRHLAFDFDKSGAVTHASLVITSPGAAAGTPPVQQIDATFTADSMRMESRRDTSVQITRVAVPAGAVVIFGASPWSTYERQTMRLASRKADSLNATFYYMGSSSLGSISLHRLGRDSMVIRTSNDLYHARIDREGHLLDSVPIEGTAQFSIHRVTSLDLPGMTAAFLAREQQAGAMGTLSPRDTVRASAGGASLWIDYGRPSKRGRAVYGGIVPWGEVWRTGANAATQFRTDKALVMGGQTVPAGFYTLWTVPSPTGWKLIVNGETGQWGTEHKAARDLYTLDMKVSSLPQSVERFAIGIEPSPGGGTLNLDWDTTRASIPFTVQP